MLVLDNARTTTRPFPSRSSKIASVLTRLFLLPYSPQLAPVEDVWTLARRLVTQNRFFATLDDVLTAISACFDR